MIIKDARKAMGMTQRELAAAVGLNLRHLQRIENGVLKAENLTARTTFNLCSVLGLGLDELLEDADGDSRLRVDSVLTAEAAEELTAKEQRCICRLEQAEEYSGLRRYPTTCEAVFRRIPSNWWGRYGTRHIGEVAALLNKAYNDGRQNPSPDEYVKIDIDS